MATTVSAHAPAKVNLALSVGAARADGMHEIASWMVTTDFGDDLVLRRLSAGTPSRYAIQWAADARRRSEIDWSVSKDLAVRAHLALEAALGRALPVQMLLEKRIPVGGGLGGGSSNAAAMLRALDALFDLRLRREYLEEVARTLGSDVPFLVRGGSAFVEGLGERVSAAPAHDTHLVLVFPEAHCPTGQVYRAFDAVRRDARVDAERVRALARGRVAVDAPFNDLADAACTVAPALDELREEIGRLARQPVHVSGSGSTLFLVADDPFHAEALAGSVEMKLALPAVVTRTAPVREEHVDGAPRVGEVAVDDDD